MNDFTEGIIRDTKKLSYSMYLDEEQIAENRKIRDRQLECVRSSGSDKSTGMGQTKPISPQQNSNVKKIEQNRSVQDIVDKSVRADPLVGEMLLRKAIQTNTNSEIKRSTSPVIVNKNSESMRKTPSIHQIVGMDNLMESNDQMINTEPLVDCSKFDNSKFDSSKKPDIDQLSEKSRRSDTDSDQMTYFDSINRTLQIDNSDSLVNEIGMGERKFVRTKSDAKKMSVESRKISRWVDDGSVVYCYNCDAEFGLLLRKHHCRACGRVFCHYCSNYYTVLPLDIIRKIPDRIGGYSDYLWNEDLNKEVRCCGKCYKYVNGLIGISRLIKVFELCSFNIQELILLSEISDDFKEAARFCLSKFREIQYKMSIEDMTEYEKRMCWINRNFLVGHSRWMVCLVKSTDFESEIETKILEDLMYKNKVNTCWNVMCTRFCTEKIGILDMLDLIRFNQNNPIISNLIVKCLETVRTNELRYYLPFLTVNIPNNIYLLDMMLARGLDSFEFMSNLYWCLEVYCNDITKRKEYVIKLLQYIKEHTRDNNKDYRKRFQLMMKNGLLDLDNLAELNKIDRICLPIFPSVDFKRVDLNGVMEMASNSKPLMIPFIDQNGYTKKILYKKEDLRKDHIIMNMIELINHILKTEENMDIMTVRYNVVPTSAESGYIEIVENSQTIFTIIEKTGFTIQNYIMEFNKNISIQEFRERFIKSTALYCVISYLIGIGDRHLDNIMISKDGLLFHIDFSYILGQDPKYSNNKVIRVTPEIVNVIGGYESSDYKYFKECCTRIYNRLRLHVNLFSNLLSVIPEIDPKLSMEMIRRELIDRFEIGENCLEAATHMSQKVDTDKHSFEYQIIDFLYKVKKSTFGNSLDYVKNHLKNHLIGIIRYPFKLKDNGESNISNQIDQTDISIFGYQKK